MLIIAPPRSYRLAPYLRAAEHFGLQPLIVSDGKHSLVTEVAHGLHIDFEKPGQALALILEQARQQPIAGIIATDDFTVELAARVAEALSLPHNPPETARTCSRKELSRSTLKQAGLPVPDFRLIRLGHSIRQQLADFPLPCVIKPLNLSASRGVIRANTLEDVDNACARIAAIIRDQPEPEDRQRLLVEAYIQGQEVAVEGFVSQGEFQCLALFDKPDPLEGPYFEETYYVTPSRLSLDIQQRITQTTADACAALGLVTGPVHAEFRIDSTGQPWILEVAARTIGGECARLLQFGTGRTLEELVVAYATGREQAPQTLEDSAGVLMIPTPKSGILRRVEGVMAAQQVPLIDDVRINIREGHELIALPEGSGYLGFIFARGPDPASVEKALREAHNTLNIVIAPLWKIEGAPASAGIVAD